jgi:hypothetical protein
MIRTTLAVLLAFQAVTAVPGADPFAFFQPSVVLTADERAQLARGQAIARTLRGQDLEVSVFAAVPVAVDGDRLVAWMRRIEELKRSSYVLAIARFSDPPRVEDLAGLVLDDDELSEIRACRPGSCGLKLSADEMTRLQKAAADAGNDWKPAIQRAFRQAVLERVKEYLASGRMVPYDDRPNRVWPATRFNAVLDHSSFLTEHLPRLAAHLRGYPSTAAPDAESFVYWSREQLAGKTTINVTHVSIVRGRQPGSPDALVTGKMIFTTHYIDASLGVTALVRGERTNYLAYVNRSEVDVLHGMFSGVVRWLVQRRLETEAGSVLQGLRQRLESGDPPERRTQAVRRASLG